MPRVSVVIPTYNSLQYLPFAVESALNQTFVDIEIIIINDGSTDRTEEWGLQQSDPRLKLITQENLGKSAARNAGIEAARGDYIAFLDADDLWEPTKLEMQVNCLDKSPHIGLVYTWTVLADRDGRPTGHLISSRAAGDVWKDLVCRNILACGSTPLVRRNCFEVTGLFSPDLPFAQDWDMWIRLAAHYPFAVIEKPLVRYRRHENNTSRKLDEMYRYNTLVLKRAFQSTSIDTSEIRGRAYQSIHLYLGWIALQIQDCNRALFFWRKAYASAPRLSLSWEPIRLLLYIAAAQIFSLDKHGKLMNFGRELRYRLLMSLSLIRNLLD